jgi:ComF family protein
MKFHSHPEIASFIGILLGSMMAKDSITADLIVPVPLSASRQKERGYNQAALIAKEASRILNIPYSEKVLTRTRDTERQTEITDNAVRSLNVQGAFAVSEDFYTEGLKVIVVDDVATTGNTLHEAALALKKAGAAEVLCCASSGNRAVLNAESC